MKRLLMLVSLAAFLPLLVALPVGAEEAAPQPQGEKVLSRPCEQYVGRPAEEVPTLCKDNVDTTPDNNPVFGPNGILTKATRILMIVIGVASVIMIILGGIQYMLSTGDSAKVNNAKNTILYAIVGLVIALVAQGIIAFVLTPL
jgi:hypothetical protein